LYETTRQEILTYLRSAGVSYREDSSNAKPLYLRNRIRREVIPLLTQLVPSSIKALCRLADLCRADDHHLDQEVAARMAAAVKWDSTGEWTLDRQILVDLPLPLQRRCLRRLLRRGDPQQRPPSLHRIERVLRLVSTPESVSRVDMKVGHIVVTKQALRFLPFPVGHGCERRHWDSDAPRATLPVPGELIWSGTGQRLQVQLQEYDRRETVLGQERILVDADRVTHSLTIRSWLPGDRFCPRGMDGHSKKVQDFFTDLKIPMAKRDRIPLVVAPEGILWIVGYRQDERWMPTSLTARCFVITVHPPPLTEGTD
jgi:tRNA(Ile)-lysidine synthase